MAIDIYPVMFEAYDEVKEPLFKIKAIDDCCAEVVISSPMTVELWDEISQSIKACLISMKLGE